MQQELKLKALLALVANLEHGAQTFRAKSDAVDEAEIARPGLLELVGQSRAVEPKVKLHAVI